MSTNDEEEDEGELFDFDSGDEIPEADRQALVPPPPDPGSNTEHQEANVTGESAGWVLPPLGRIGHRIKKKHVKSLPGLVQGL